MRFSIFLAQHKQLFKKNQLSAFNKIEEKSSKCNAFNSLKTIQKMNSSVPWTRFAHFFVCGVLKPLL
jgi:hypothetical protein